MQFFLDTANVESIKKYADWGVIDGITTNPTLIAREGADLEKRIKEITRIIKGPVSVEVLSTETKDMVKEARSYAAWAPNIYIKLPCSENGLKACKILSDEGISVNMTLVFSATQALLAAKAGARLISPFVGRLDDVGEDGMALIAELMDIFQNYDFKTQVVVASIRHPRHVVEAARMGAHIATIPPDVMEKLIKHPLTDKGIQAFLNDWEKARKK